MGFWALRVSDSSELNRALGYGENASHGRLSTHLSRTVPSGSEALQPTIEKGSIGLLGETCTGAGIQQDCSGPQL